MIPTAETRLRFRKGCRAFVRATATQACYQGEIESSPWRLLMASKTPAVPVIMLSPSGAPGLMTNRDFSTSRSRILRR